MTYEEELAHARRAGFNRYTASPQFQQQQADATVEILQAFIRTSQQSDEAAPPVRRERSKVLSEAPWHERLDEASEASWSFVLEDTETVALTSDDISLRTLRRRIEKFLDPDDYTVTVGKHGKKTYLVDASMVGWVNRRLR
jgi:hypothetical protein